MKYYSTNHQAPDASLEEAVVTRQMIIMITAFTRLKILSPTDSFIFVLWPALFAVLFNSCPFIDVYKRQIQNFGKL